MKIYFITTNKHKLRESRQILKEHEILNKRLELSEIQADPIQIAVHKANEAYKKLKKPCFVDDSGLCFNALNGLPGEYVKFFLEKLGAKKLCKLLDGFKDKSAYALCVIAYHDGKKVRAFSGRVDGKIVEPRGMSNFGKFGWDPIFLPDGYNKTFAQMKPEEKNKISHRYKAYRKFAESLK